MLNTSNDERTHMPRRVQADALHTGNPLTENVAAISGEIHATVPAYQVFYKRWADTLSGFPGIWNYCALAGEVFTECETPGCWDHGDWVEAIDAYVKFILEAATLPTVEDLRFKAKELIPKPK